MRTRQELEFLREQAVTLRREGKSLRQIKQILGPMSNVTLHDALRGVPPPDWTRRPNAKDEQRAKARELRAQGMDYEEIATDPSLIRFFLRFLEATGTPAGSLAFRVYIHESAETSSAELFWLEVTGARPEQFLSPALKRHNPKTVRKNVGEDYHGCLRIEVRQGSDLYRKIDGWAEAIMSAR
jgi:hypothetical protein